MIGRLLFCILFLLCGCTGEEHEKPDKPAVIPDKKYSCRDCHELKTDEAHGEIACTTCHQGREPALSAEEAHQNLIQQPAHPLHMETSCGPCHAEQLNKARHSSHFTVKNKTNLVRRAFGAVNDLQTLVDIPQHEEIATELDLAEDLLRRRCLRCHVYYGGDNYPQALHGTGCAACHLQFSKGRMLSHVFVKSPADSQCLHCHHGNYVGADYYGRYEHDLHWDYRTPFKKDGRVPRSYGVEYHQLSTDVHHRAGINCIDCHSGAELMTDEPKKLSCSSCHLHQPGSPPAADNLHEIDGKLHLRTRLGRKDITIPPATHPAHEKYKNEANCTVCHAQWSFSDAGTHLLRLDVEKFDPWGALYVQGSYEVEGQVTTSLYSDDSYPYVFMSDKITGELYSGIWLKGYELRRWEFPIICRDENGILQVCRPLLDLHLSFVNENEEVVFDAITPANVRPFGLLPYVPHTIGKAGAFFSERLQENTDLLKQPLNLEKKQLIIEN